MDWHRQCTIEKPIPNGVVRQVSWIPEKFAVQGKYLKLLEDDVWENGWLVMQVGGRRPSADVNIRSRDHLRQRDASDI
jgi:hypothetical protein